MKNSPWGAVQSEELLAPGITSVSTSSHGGIHLTKSLNKKVPAFMRRENGWYEEDVDWSIVAMIFPEVFSESSGSRARDIFRNWRPDEYEQLFHEIIPPGMSHVKDEALFHEQHLDDYLVMSAVGDWKQGVPKGFVGVFAGKGGRTKTGRYPDDTAWFLVPEHEYDARSPFGFVVDPSRHERIKPLD